jgi:ABC-2 type transport system permease protein
MLADTYTVLWKELKELLGATLKPATLFGFALQILIFGILPVFMVKELFVALPVGPLYWLVLAMMISTGTSVNAFAGERERHTLETLLATRLSDRAILLGKIAASVIYALLFVLLAMITGLVAVNLFYAQGSLLFYTPIVGFGGLLTCMLMAGVLAAGGVLVSLRSATVREAGQKLSLGLMLFFLPTFMFGAIPIEQRKALIDTLGGLNMSILLTLVLLVLLAANVGLIYLAMQRFERETLSSPDTAAKSATEPKQNRNTPPATQAEQQTPTLDTTRPTADAAIKPPSLLTDILTVVGKEWREITTLGGNKRSTLTTIGILVLIFGILMPLQSGREMMTSGTALSWWIALPMLLMTRVIADVFAGERERHTLETLLATRLPNHALLAGKIIAPLLWAWLITQVLILIGMLTINIATWNGTPLIYSPAVALSGIVGGLLSGGFVATAGALVSLRASTAQQAQQILSVATFALVLIPVFLLLLVARFAPPALVESVGASIIAGGPLLIGMIVGGFVALLDVGLFFAAMKRFQRAQLILD